MPTSFEIKVWAAIDQIPKGSVITYKELANKIGHPNAVRAVANACGKNPNPILTPCHRVIRSDGRPGGYSAPGGIKKKDRAS
jgi:O-6-methylguanine DNA methyltransferase